MRAAAGLVQAIAGAALVAAAWLLPRRTAGARLVVGPQLLLDAGPWLLAAAVLIAASGRPLFAGAGVLVLSAGFTLADRTMRETLKEPVVFSSVSELPQVFLYPHLYLPFAGPVLVIGGALAGLVVAVGLLLLEPARTQPRPFATVAALALLAAVGVLIGREPMLGLAARLMQMLGPTGDPDADAVALGPFAALLVYGVIARAERGARRQVLAAPAVGRERCRGTAGPIVIVQCESFFDARRLSPLVPADLLPNFDACRRSAAMCGRLEVPGWGANTMRTEFAVLTGIPEAALGYDRFNPYYALSRVPIDSQVWRLRHAGYRTICLHPFDRRFFRRDLAMPALGFDAFLGREALGGTRAPPFYSDPDLAQQILRVLDAEGPRTFIFAITIENHGPWSDLQPLNPDMAAVFGSEDLPQRNNLLCHLAGLQRSDRMLQVLMEGLEQRPGNATLAFYGDHLPSLPQAFRHFAFDLPHSDYVIWPAGGAAPLREDLPAHQLGRLVVDAVLGEAESAPRRMHRASPAAPRPLSEPLLDEAGP